VSEPYTGGAVNAIIVLYSEHTATTLQNACLLIRAVRLVIICEGTGNHLAAFGETESHTGIANVGADDTFTPGYCDDSGSTRELCVDGRVAEKVLLEERYRLSDSGFHVGRESRVREKGRRELGLEKLRDAITSFTMAIKNAKEKRSGLLVLFHNQYILVLFPGVIRCVSLLRHTCIGLDPAPPSCHVGGSCRVVGGKAGKAFDEFVVTYYGKTAAGLAEALAISALIAIILLFLDKSREGDIRFRMQAPCE
jgi:hypothetical protein